MIDKAKRAALQRELQELEPAVKRSAEIEAILAASDPVAITTAFLIDARDTYASLRAKPPDIVTAPQQCWDNLAQKMVTRNLPTANHADRAKALSDILGAIREIEELPHGHPATAERAEGLRRLYNIQRSK